MTYRLSLLVLLFLGVVACNKEEPVEKQLANLRAERAAIDDKIRSLESITASTSVDGVPVTVHKLHAAAFHHVIDVKGTVDSRTTIVVTPKMPGVITKLAVVNGQAVGKGQLIAEQDNATIKAGINEIQSQLEFASILFEKQRRIYEQKAGSEVQYLSSKSQKESLERRMASMKEQLEMSRLYAPVSGVVDNLISKVGEQAMPGMPMMTIVNTADMRIVADLAETYAADVQVGDKATIIFSGFGDTLQSKVSIAARNVNALKRTFQIEIPIQHAPKFVRPNMTVGVIINDRTIENAITIPLSSILREGTSSYVYVVNDKNLSERRDINTGLVSGDMVHVVSGLTSNERVVVRGALDVSQGQLVHIIQ